MKLLQNLPKNIEYGLIKPRLIEIPHPSGVVPFDKKVFIEQFRSDVLLNALKSGFYDDSPEIKSLLQDLQKLYDWYEDDYVALSSEPDISSPDYNTGVYLSKVEPESEAVMERENFDFYGENLAPEKVKDKNSFEYMAVKLEVLILRFFVESLKTSKSVNDAIKLYKLEEMSESLRAFPDFSSQDRDIKRIAEDGLRLNLKFPKNSGKSHLMHAILSRCYEDLADTVLNQIEDGEINQDLDSAQKISEEDIQEIFMQILSGGGLIYREKRGRTANKVLSVFENISGESIKDIQPGQLQIFIQRRVEESL